MYTPVTMMLLLSISAAPVIFAWPVAHMFAASERIPASWSAAKEKSDVGVLRAATNMVVASQNADTLISFSVQPSVVASISEIYAVAYSLVTGNIISPVGKTSVNDLHDLGVLKGGMVSMRIPAATIQTLSSTCKSAAVRVAIIAPEANKQSDEDQWAVDSIILVVGSASSLTDNNPATAVTAQLLLV